MVSQPAKIPLGKQGFTFAKYSAIPSAVPYGIFNGIPYILYWPFYPEFHRKYLDLDLLKKRGFSDCDTLSYILSTRESVIVENVADFLNQIVRSHRLKDKEFVEPVNCLLSCTYNIFVCANKGCIRITFIFTPPIFQSSKTSSSLTSHDSRNSGFVSLKGVSKQMFTSSLF